MHGAWLRLPGFLRPILTEEHGSLSASKGSFRIHRVEILEAEPGSGISPFDSLWEAGWEGRGFSAASSVLRPEPGEPSGQSSRPGGRGADKMLPLSFKTQAEGRRTEAPRPLHGAEEDPRPEARPGRRRRTSAGSRGGPRRWPTAGLGGWTAAGRAGRRLPSAPGGRASGPTVRNSGARGRRLRPGRQR